jgi:hypothetical protein
LAVAWVQVGSQPRELYPHQLRITTSAGDHVALVVSVRDGTTAGNALAAALLVRIDGREAQHMLLTPGSGRAAYDALLGPLDAGEHQLSLEPSTLWEWPEDFEIIRARADVKRPSDQDAVLLAYAPLLGLRGDTILDRGRSLVTIRPVPVFVRLEGRTRESVMDDHPWIYGVMARELVAERRIGTEIDDPRTFLYVEANVNLENAAVSASARSATGGDWQDSSRGREDLTVERDGWIRIAIPAAAGAATLRWRCHPRPGEAKNAKALCQIKWTRAFTLDRNFEPGENMIEPGFVSIGSGLTDPVRVRRF